MKSIRKQECNNDFRFISLGSTRFGCSRCRSSTHSTPCTYLAAGADLKTQIALIARMAYYYLPSNRICLKRELHSLSWIDADRRKVQQKPLPRNVFALIVECLLIPKLLSLIHI